MSKATLNLRVANLDCENDAAAIQRALQKMEGVQHVAVLPGAAKVIVEINTETLQVEQIRQQLSELGFPPLDHREMPTMPPPWRNKKVITSILSGVLLLAGWLLQFSNLSPVISLGFYLLSMVMGGYYFTREALEMLVFSRKVGIELLMSLAAVVAAFMGQAMEGAMLAFLYSLSEAAEGYTEEKTRSAIKALMNLAPRVALVRRNGQEVEIPVEEIAVGDVFIIKPGQAIPTDGEVIQGNSSVNEAPITGESMPVSKKPGDPIYAGSINGQGLLEAKATRVFSDNTLSRIIQLVEEAQERKGRSQRFIERFGQKYSPAVLIGGIFLALMPPLFGLGDWHTWLMRATVFIVAAAPCALVISIPITLVAALGTAARNGVLIKGGIYLEELARIRVIALDKTGTLTMGLPEVTDVWLVTSDGEMNTERLIQIAAAIEKGNEHPLARAIVRFAQEKAIHFPRADQIKILPGAGAKGTIQGREYYVGNPDFFEKELKISLTPILPQLKQLQHEGKMVVLVGTPEKILGVWGFRDKIRDNAARAIQRLRQMGIQHIAMLTGDNSQTANAIASNLGIDMVFAELKPQDKLRIVRELSQKFGHVAMVGDGVNDAPALAEAQVGIAMGAIGTDVAMETADVVLMADDLEKLVVALQLARRTQKVVQQNLIFSAIVISSLVVGAIIGSFSLPIAILGHELSEFLVIGNGLRLLKI